MSGSCAQWRGEIGAYIVGALDGPARARVSRHLVACPGCRADYDELVPVRDWLSHLTAAAGSPDPAPCGPPGTAGPPVASGRPARRCTGAAPAPSCRAAGRRAAR